MPGYHVSPYVCSYPNGFYSTRICSPIAGGSFSPITKSLFVKVFRRRLVLAGVPQAPTYRGHSFRRGGANWAFQCGVPGELIQVFGDWSSEAYKRYLEFALPAKLRVATRVSQALLRI